MSLYGILNLSYEYTCVPVNWLDKLNLCGVVYETGKKNLK